MAQIEEKKTQTDAVEKKAAKPAKKKTAVIKNADVAWAVLLEPWITEKSHAAMAERRYTFKVVRGSDKKQIKKAVEGLYGVNVEKVAVTNVPAKRKNYGRHAGMQSAIKKAVVTVKEGQSIELFKGA
jgi:large subunit ribosomal protein L23